MDEINYLTTRLRALSRYAHDDKSIGDEAADAIEQLQVDVERLRRMSADAALYQRLRDTTAQALADMQAQGVMVEWQTLIAEALGGRPT